MAIRIQEWGMLRNAAQQPQISLHGLTDWERGAEQAGHGIAAMVLGGTRMMQERRAVETTGELAAFSETLRSIEQETREELQEHPAEDWEYAWHAASAPRVAAAIAELPPPLREPARRMAEHHTHEAAIRAWRDKELSGIDKARAQWQARVDDAVQAGDGEMARKWLEQGRGVFVPEANLPDEEKQVLSRAGLKHWCRKLQRTPMQTLGEYFSAPHPTQDWRREEAEELELMVDKARQQAQTQFADVLQSRLEQGKHTEEAEWQQALQAGIISQAQYDAALSSPQNLSPNRFNYWLRRVIEHDATPASHAAMKLEICTAAMPVPQRLDLLQQLNQAVTLRREDRLSLCRKLWHLYNSGAFGCPGDALAEKRLQQLQMSGLPMLSTDGNEAVAQWLESLDRREAQWICFSPQNA